jgi:hypothetical protein
MNQSLFFTGRPVEYDLAVRKPDDPLGGGGNRVVMGDEDDRVSLPVQILQQVKHIPACFGVQRAGGLVRKDHGGVAGQRAGNGHALLLAAGELRRNVFQLIG